MSLFMTGDVSIDEGFARRKKIPRGKPGEKSHLIAGLLPPNASGRWHARQAIHWGYSGIGRNGKPIARPWVCVETRDWSKGQRGLVTQKCEECDNNRAVAERRKAAEAYYKAEVGAGRMNDAQVKELMSRMFGAFSDKGARKIEIRYVVNCWFPGDKVASGLLLNKTCFDSLTALRKSTMQSIGLDIIATLRQAEPNAPGAFAVMGTGPDGTPVTEWYVSNPVPLLDFVGTGTGFGEADDTVVLKTEFAQRAGALQQDVQMWQFTGAVYAACGNLQAVDDPSPAQVVTPQQVAALVAAAGGGFADPGQVDKILNARTAPPVQVAVPAAPVAPPPPPPVPAPTPFVPPAFVAPPVPVPLVVIPAPAPQVQAPAAQAPLSYDELLQQFQQLQQQLAKAASPPPPVPPAPPQPQPPPLVVPPVNAAPSAGALPPGAPVSVYDPRLAVQQPPAVAPAAQPPPPASAPQSQPAGQRFQAGPPADIGSFDLAGLNQMTEDEFMQALATNSIFAPGK